MIFWWNICFAKAHTLQRCQWITALSNSRLIFFEKEIKKAVLFNLKKCFNRITLQNACMISILTQNKNKFWNINILCTGTATHWPTPHFYWILVFHIMRKHFVLFVPKSDVTENLTTLLFISFFIGIFCGVHIWEKFFCGFDYQNTVLGFKKCLTITKSTPFHPPLLRKKNQKKNQIKIGKESSVTKIMLITICFI